MPKIGLTKSEWRERLSLFAQGNFKFGKGQRPPRGSDRARELERVEKCPKHSNTMQIDPFGRKIQCLCGYHQQQVSQMQSKIKSIARCALFFSHIDVYYLRSVCHLSVISWCSDQLLILFNCSASSYSLTCWPFCHCRVDREQHTHPGILYTCMIVDNILHTIPRAFRNMILHIPIFFISDCASTPSSLSWCCHSPSYL